MNVAIRKVNLTLDFSKLIKKTGWNKVMDILRIIILYHCTNIDYIKFKIWEKNNLNSCYSFPSLSHIFFCAVCCKKNGSRNSDLFEMHIRKMLAVSVNSKSQRG